MGRKAWPPGTLPLLFLLLKGVHSLSLDVSLSCPEGYTLQSDKCLRAYSKEASWEEAQRFCTSRGGSLARVENERENEAIGEILSHPEVEGRRRFWIGLKATDGDEYSWTDGRLVSQYIGLWEAGEPRDETGNCVMVSNARIPQWTRSPCKLIAPFVCQIPACVQGSYFCRNGRCASEGDVCNGRDECGDRSDEDNCPGTPCRVHVRSEEGSISSPGFPSSYGTAEDCQWILEAPINHRIQITFESMDTEEVVDVVTVTDGLPSSLPNSTILLASLSGKPTKEKLNILSTGNVMTVRFQSDRAIFGKGFTAKWKAVSFTCGGLVTAQAFGQLLTSPSYPSAPPPGVECAWLISSIPGQVISLSMEDVDVGDATVEIYDGETPSAALLASYGGGRMDRMKSVIASGLDVVISRQSSVYVYFRAASKNNGKGLSLNYKRGCDIVIRRSFGTLMSPGGTADLPYPGGVQCSYTIESPSSPSVALSLLVNRFDLSAHDTLEIYEGSSKGSAIHNDDGFTQAMPPPAQVEIRQSRATIVFRSSGVTRGLSTHKGFNISFSTNCPPLTKPPKVSLSSRNTGYGTKVSVSCPKGFEFSDGRGSFYVTECTIGGNWTVSSVPSCQPVYCSPVPQIPNGFAANASNTRFGGTARYTCYDGFSFDSARKFEEIKCEASGDWSTLPICRASSCPALPPFLHGERLLAYGDGSGYGSVYRYECSPGFRRKGDAALMCQKNGQWSIVQPTCSRIECPSLPRVLNGRLLVQRPFLFDHTAQLVCNEGFEATGPTEVRCQWNATVSKVGSCVDVNECEKGTARCQSTSSSCKNLPGGYHCSCLPGFTPLLKCESAKTLPVDKVTVSSQPTGRPPSTSTWCATLTDDERRIRLHFPVPFTVDKLHFERENGGFPTEVTLSYSSSHGMPLKKITHRGNSSVFAIKNAVSTAGSYLSLPHSIEAAVLEIEIQAHTGPPCVKIEAMGCQRLSCMDNDECDENNGGCEQLCINTLGGHHCSCRDGYDLVEQEKEGQRSKCIPRKCPPLSNPSHGLLLSTLSSFPYPISISFQCEFGYQMEGSETLRCQEDGTWNASAPTCSPALCDGVSNNTEIGLFASSKEFVPFGQKVEFHCTQKSRPATPSSLGQWRECMYDPRPHRSPYWLAGPPIDCPLVECSAPPSFSGVVYTGDLSDRKVGAKLDFACRPPYSLVGRSSYDDRSIRCTMDGSWDVGDLRCEGPVCVDPGYPVEGQVHLTSVEEGALVTFSCNRPGYRPFPSESISCELGTPCLISEDVGISSGYVHDGAFADNSDDPIWGYEPHKARLTSTGWCGHKDNFIFLSVDLQRIHTLTSLRLAGVAGSGHIRGHVTKLQLFYKTQFSQNYDTYPVEFETPSGNHNALHQFELNPPLRARFILLGVSEYEENPCLRFDLHGCLAPLNAAHDTPLQVGWNASVPECIDAEPPTFVNCPTEPLEIPPDEYGQLSAANYAVPRAVDNSGRIAWLRIDPEHFEPPKRITEDTDVVYTAFDEAGNSAECIVRLRIPDTQPPILRCPDSYSVYGEDALQIVFNETSVPVAVQDVSNVSLVFTPTHATLEMGEDVTVTVTAIDAHKNRAECRFQVAHQPEPCSSSSLSSSNTTLRSCSKKGGRVECVISCTEGHRFVDETQVETLYTCVSGHWSPTSIAPSCVPIAEEPSRYELSVRVDYPVEGNINSKCLQAYSDAVASHFDALDGVLSTRCSSSVQVFVRVLDVKFTYAHDKISANYTLQVLPTVLQNVFYDLCSLTLRTLFDLRIPGATTPVRHLLNILAESLPLPQGDGCPSLQAVGSEIGQGFGCSPGEVLRETTGDGLPECLLCPMGSVNVNNTCIPCPLGSYQDQAGQVACKGCPQGKWTEYEGSISLSSCLSTCGNGMYSSSGLVPCQPCPRHTFSGPPTEGGITACQACPGGAYTAQVGSAGPSLCVMPCTPGTYSRTGLQPCSPCPAHFYQPSIGQQRCIECTENTRRLNGNGTSRDECIPIECDKVQCRNKGICKIRDHTAVCDCPPGYIGKLCEKTDNLCDGSPCVNGGVCEVVSGTFRCRCPPSFSGRFCQLAPHECSGIHCPNGGVCQDLPGLRSTKCVCRTGFSGPHCQEISDACTSEKSPCENGSECIPLPLGRFKCKCTAGWRGTTCGEQIDDCASRPCALNATCTDLVNDFRCDCPPGFSGKRCQFKEELCSNDACLHGMCVDRLTKRECLCEPGWTGEACDVNIDECEDDPCKNGGLCRDMIDGFTCKCPAGFHGKHCEILVDHCAEKPCKNNGTCTNEGATYSCECPLGFEGLHCEENINECATSACAPLGTEKCIDGIESFECICNKGWEGTLCEIKLDQCASHPCLNEGTCVDTGSSFQCECSPGWTGERCDHETGICSTKPCKNNGTCINLANDYFCACPEGVSGRHCEHTPDRCIGNPCKEGICTDLGSSMECTCPAGRFGDSCQFESISCSATSCLNGGTCQGEPAQCICLPGFSGERCEVNVDECEDVACPRGARCVDQINSAVCVCPMNATGAHCDKTIDVDYDLHFLPDSSPSRAARRVPSLTTRPLTELSVALWLKFDQKDGRGRILTLYNSSSPNYGANLREVISISSEAIELTLVEGEKTVRSEWSSEQSVNDGKWHHVVITWSSSTGIVSFIWNSVRIFTESEYLKGSTVDASFLLNLGSPITDPRPPYFEGRITRVSVWERALDFETEIPSLVGDCSSPEILNDVLIRFIDFDNISGRVERVGRSDCGRKEELSQPRIHIDICPGDLTVVTEARETIVNWTEPRFSLPSSNPSASPRLVDVRQNLRNGQLLPIGVHDIVYVAKDDLGRTAYCAFKVNILHTHCPSLEDPVNGEQTCEDWGPHLRYKACSIRCREGHAFSIPPASFYTCSFDGRWRPRPDNSSSLAKFKYPQCTKHVPATRMVSLSLDFPAVSHCTSAARDALKENAYRKITELNEKWSFCNLKDSSGCVGAKVSVECDTLAPTFMKRRAKKDLRLIEDDHDLTEIYREKREEKTPIQLFKLHISLPVKRENIYDHQTRRSISVVEILEDEILRNRVLNLEKILPNGRPDLHTLRVDHIYHCQIGSVVVEDLCVPCSPGTFFDVDSQSCMPCEIGHYQPQPGRTQCRACIEGFTTVAKGSIAESECRASCKAGHFLDLSDSSSSCSPCGFGFYQPSQGSFECLACPIGQTTLTSTAVNVTECRDECPDGEELSSVGCMPCPHGWFRARGGHSRCVQCPSGTTTSKDRAKKREDCDTPKCARGQFLVPASKQCQLCPRGAFQDEEEKTACKLCPPDHTTAAQGATSESQCFSTNQCATGEDDCSWHAVCIDLPDDLDRPRYECRCKPGYRGNGTHCYDACHDYCLNDGVCKKNPIGYVECVCKESFSGERCEHRFQPRGHKVAIVTGTICAIVGILIVIVIIIFMISFRTNRVIDSVEKGDGMVTPFGGRINSTSDFGAIAPNFLVASRAADAPRPIGYYYEDDDEYDMKTMYIGDGNMIESGVGSRGERTNSSSSTAALNPDLEKRRRIAQQHMYTPQRGISSTLEAQSPSQRRLSTATTTGHEERSPL